MNSARNVLAAWGGQAVSVIGSFIVRAVFVAVLAEEYVACETVFSSVLTMLTLADLGIGSAITYNLYEPLAKNDHETVKSIMRLFKRAYIVIGCVIIILGACLAPNISVVLGKDAPHVPLLEVYFFCFVLNTGISYFFSYKGALISADQKSYIVYLIQYGFQIVLSIAQVIVLLVTRNYLLFLFCMLASTLFQNICLAVVANRKYPFLKEKDVRPIARDIVDNIKKNVTGLVIHKVAGVASNSATTLIISTFLGVTVTALYGNYLMVVNSLTRIVDRVFDSTIASVGNLSAQESEERQHEVFQTLFFVNAVVYAVISGGLLCSFNAFIELWVGASWQYAAPIVVCIVVLFYVKGMRSASLAFTSAYGLYWLTKWKAVMEAIVIVGLGLALVRPLGIIGVLLASIISSVFVSTLYEAWAIYRHGFHRPLRLFVRRYLTYVAVAAAGIFSAFAICGLISFSGVFAFLVKGVIGVAVPFALYLAFFFRSREYREFWGIVKSLGLRLAGKMRHRV